MKNTDMANNSNNNYYGNKGGRYGSGDGGGGIEYLCEAFLQLPFSTKNEDDEDDNDYVVDDDDDNDAVILSMRVLGNNKSNNNSSSSSRNVLVVFDSGKISTIPIIKRHMGGGGGDDDENDDVAGEKDSLEKEQQQEPSSSAAAAAVAAAATTTANDIQILISTMKEKLQLYKIESCTTTKLPYNKDSILLLGYGLLYLLADVYGIFELHEDLIHDINATMFGYTGKKDIMTFKKSYLPSSTFHNSTYSLSTSSSSSSSSLLVVPNYYIDSIHEIDILNCCVVANFVCYIPGKEGKGIDVAKFEKSTWKVINVEAIRHGSVIFEI